MAEGVELATAWIRLVPTVEGITDQVVKSAGGPGMEKAGKTAGKKWSAGAKTAMTIGAAAVSAAVVGIFNTGIDELKFGEQINAQTDILISNTGFAMKTDEIGDYTLALSQLSGVSEEDLQSAGNNILKFGDISEENYKKAVASINDLAASGKDAAGVSEGLGKALADPATAAGKLRRMGISLTEQQEALIKTMVESGDKAGAQAVILESLESTYGGMAEAAGGTLQGNLNRLNNSWENLAGAAVESLMPAIEGVVGLLQGFVGFISENQAILPIFVGVLGFLALAFVGVTVATWAMNTALLANPITWIILGIVALIAVIIALAMNWDAVVAWISDVWGGFIGWITGVIDGFVGWWNGVWSAVGAWINEVWTGIVVAVMTAWLRVSGWVRKAIDGFVSWWDGIWEGVGNAIRDVFSGIGSFISGVWAGIVDGIRGYVNSIIGLVNSVIDGINAVASVAGGVFGLDISIAKIPQLAAGATVLPRKGGTAAVLAEAGRAESVVDTGLINRALEDGIAGTGGSGGGDTYILNGITTRAAAEELARETEKKKRRRVASTLATVGVG